MYTRLTQLLKQKQIILQNDKLSPAALRRLRSDSDLLLQVVEQTSFLQYNASLKERLQCIIQQIDYQPRCNHCGVEVKMRTSGRSIYTFPGHCSAACTSKDAQTINKRKQTNLSRYGSSNVLQSTYVKNKTNN